METPVPRMTRSRARGLATPATGVPGARKAAVAVPKTMTASKGKLQAEPSDDVIPFAALSTDQGEAEPGEPEFEGEAGNLGSSVGSASKTTESQPAPQLDQALASPEPSEVDLAPLLVVGSMQIEEAMQPEDKPQLFSNTATAEPQAEFVSSAAVAAAFASEVELSLGDCSVEGTPEVSNEGAEDNTDMLEDGELAEEQQDEEQQDEEQQDEDQPLEGEELEAEADAPINTVAEGMALPADESEEPFNTDEVPLPSELDDELLEDAPFSSDIGVPAEFTEMEEEEDVTALPSVPTSPAVAAASPCLSPPSSPVAAAPALALASPPASPLAAVPRITAQGLSKTPGPKASTRAVPAKHSLSAVKAASATPVFSRLTGRESNAAAPAALGVRFTTPVKLATTTPAKASTATLKAALKPSSTFGTPGTATKKTSDCTAPIRSVKRVSISTPVHPKSETAQRHIVRTPFPRSGGPKVLPEDEDLESEEDQEMEAGANEGTLAEALLAPGAAEAGVASEDTDMGELQTDTLPKDSDLSSEEQEEPYTEATEEMAVDAPVLKQATTPAVVPARSPLPAATTTSRLSPLPAPAETRPTGLNSAKRAQGAEALKSRARAEMGYAAQQAARPSPTPGSSSGATVPSYMAPTTARMFKMKSVAVLPENHDTTSMREVKRQLKEATAKKAATATAKEPLKMSDVRKPRLVTKATRGYSPEPSENYEDDEAQHDPAAEELLMKAMTKLEIAKPAAKIAPLKGLPAPQGKHIRFTAKGKPVESPSNTRPVLRGVPPAAGTHLRFAE